MLATSLISVLWHSALWVHLPAHSAKPADIYEQSFMAFILRQGRPDLTRPKITNPHASDLFVNTMCSYIKKIKFKYIIFLERKEHILQATSHVRFWFHFKKYLKVGTETSTAKSAQISTQATLFLLSRHPACPVMQTASKHIHSWRQNPPSIGQSV